ncbi:MAG: alpha-glucan family phosphorylase [Candidatus Nanoarchaeia archaeon]|nr:alpha-glucan family phosphorylase [Candidatus Nanoarchaeia archaeon]
MDDPLHTFVSTKHLIAYFSMEIALTPKIPNYSGGLGVLAGDTLKSFADLNLDVVGITLLSEKGYFNQKLDESNYQHENEVQWNKEEFLKKLDVTVQVQIGSRNVDVSAWEYTLIGHRGKPLKIYFLDTNLSQNSDKDKLLTSYLYGGDMDYRLEQEIILGIGGIRILRALNIAPKKYHMNEGHAAFLTLELLRETTPLLPVFEERFNLVKDLCTFTTHTPVPAGHDAFEEQKVRLALGDLFPNESRDKICLTGKFSMTALALEFSSYKNAVARKHKQVSQKMFPDQTIDHITNGVHSMTWTHPLIAELFDKYTLNWRSNPLELRMAYKIPITELRSKHDECKKELFQYVEEKTKIKLDPEVFTIGFARRSTTYKRPELVFRDFERLKHIANSKKGIQIIFAGKAHPRDTEGKKIIQRIVGLTNYSTDKLKIIFLENYDMDIAKKIISGVDLWLNTPKRPLEASGTSGMKAAHNGVPSLSILDGWWVEGCIENITGWAIGEEFVDGDDNYIDHQDAQKLYDKLEQKILPLYYEDNDEYTIVMRNSIAINAAYFNTHRMAYQYILRAYVRNHTLNN